MHTFRAHLFCTIHSRTITIETAIAGGKRTSIRYLVGDRTTAGIDGAAQVLGHPALRADLHRRIAVGVFVGDRRCAGTFQTSTLRRSGETELVAVRPTHAVLGRRTHIIGGVGFQIGCINKVVG